MKNMKKNVMIIALIFALATSGCNSASTVSMETSQEIEISEDSQEMETSEKVYKKIKVSKEGKASKVSKVFKDIQCLGNGNTSYIEGTDFQYQYLGKSNYVNYIAKGKDCTYFAIGKHIFQLDDETEILTPLCNKSNCLHEKETDSNRVTDCNAFISGDDGSVGIAYMDGFIYSVMSKVKDDKEVNVLYKIAEDGSTREVVYQWDGTVVQSWCVHRNVFYYVDCTYDENNKECFTVKEIQLNGVGKATPKTIYETEEGVSVYAFGTIQAYGTHLYFTVNGTTTEDEDKISGENWEKYSYTKTFGYNIQDNTISEIQVPNQSSLEIVSGVTFWNDKILYQAFDLKKNHQYDATENVYIAELDGTNATVLIKDMPMSRWYSSDEEYLYVSDCPESLDRIYHDPDYSDNINNNVDVEYDFTVTIDVYDKNMNLVDTMQSPFKDFPTETAYGIGDKMYVSILKETGDGAMIEYWDKSKIGTIKGKKFTFVKVCEQNYLAEELQEIVIED